MVRSPHTRLPHPVPVTVGQASGTEDESGRLTAPAALRLGETDVMPRLRLGGTDVFPRLRLGGTDVYPGYGWARLITDVYPGYGWAGLTRYPGYAWARLTAPIGR